MYPLFLIKLPLMRAYEPGLIVDIDHKKIKATLDDKVIEDIIDTHPEIKSLPTIVVSIAGVTRSGKSFLLNLFVNYLTYLEQVGDIILYVNTQSIWEIVRLESFYLRLG